MKTSSILVSSVEMDIQARSLLRSYLDAEVDQSLKDSLARPILTKVANNWQSLLPVLALTFSLTNDWVPPLLVINLETLLSGGHLVCRLLRHDPA